MKNLKNQNALRNATVTTTLLVNSLIAQLVGKKIIIEDVIDA